MNKNKTEKDMSRDFVWQAGDITISNVTPTPKPVKKEKPKKGKK